MVIIHTDVREIVKASHRIHTFQGTNQTHIQSSYCKWLPNRGTKQPMGICSGTKCHAGRGECDKHRKAEPQKPLPKGILGVNK